MNLLRSLQELECLSVVLVGSTAEYGRGPAPYRKNQVLHSVSAYGAAKAAATALGSLCWEYFGLPVTVLRPTLVYGPAQGEDLFLSQLIRAVLAGRPFAMTAGEKYRVKELQDYVKKVTAPYKYPREIEFVDILPKTVSGKIRRVQLREMEWARKGK